MGHKLSTMPYPAEGRARLILSRPAFDRLGEVICSTGLWPGWGERSADIVTWTTTDHQPGHLPGLPPIGSAKPRAMLPHSGASCSCRSTTAYAHLRARALLLLKAFPCTRVVGLEYCGGTEPSCAFASRALRKVGQPGLRHYLCDHPAAWGTSSRVGSRFA